MKIAVVLGTRPEIIKLSPVIRELEKRKLDYFILHTGQHYSHELDGVFFEQLELPKPKYNLGVGSGTHGVETGKMLAGIEKVFEIEKPDCILVEGDTNSVLAGALASVKMNIKVGHIEAGLRSYDRAMPEEINRILVDHCADYLFAPTENAKNLLIREGISEFTIFVTGNTIVDAVYQNVKLAEKKNAPIDDYFLLTLHRQENVDNEERLTSILKGLEKVTERYNIPIIYPIHPRSKKMMDKFGLTSVYLNTINPLDYLSFLKMEKHSKLILTDSGGIQEEACILGVPCVTLRDNTERKESIAVGANILAGTKPEKILDCVGLMLTHRNGWGNPFGDGRASVRILDILENEFKEKKWRKV